MHHVCISTKTHDQKVLGRKHCEEVSLLSQRRSGVTYDIHTYQIECHVFACLTAVIRCILNNAHQIERVAIANYTNDRLITTLSPGIIKRILCFAILMQVIDTAYTVI